MSGNSSKISVEKPHNESVIYFDLLLDFHEFSDSRSCWKSEFLFYLISYYNAYQFNQSTKNFSWSKKIFNWQCTVKKFSRNFPQYASNANYTKICEFSPRCVGEYFPKIGNFLKLLWNFPPYIFGKYSPKIGNFPKLLWKFPPYIMVNIPQKQGIFQNYCGTFTHIFWGIFSKNWEFSETNVGISPIYFWGMFHTSLEKFPSYFGNYPNIWKFQKLLWNFPQHIFGNFSYKLGNFLHYILGNIS